MLNSFSLLAQFVFFVVVVVVFLYMQSNAMDGLYMYLDYKSKKDIFMASLKCCS